MERTTHQAGRFPSLDIQRTGRNGRAHDPNFIFPAIEILTSEIPVLSLPEKEMQQVTQFNHDVELFDLALDGLKKSSIPSHCIMYARLLNKFFLTQISIDSQFSILEWLKANYRGDAYLIVSSIKRYYRFVSKPKRIENPSKRGLSTSERFDILQRDKFVCQYCGRTSPDVRLVVDHIKPYSRGGLSERENLITACDECNKGKFNVLLSEENERRTKELAAAQS